MRSFQIGDCKIDVLPIVHGLVTEAEKVRSAYGGYEAYACALGIEGVMGIKNRSEIDDEFGINELDIAYAKHMEAFGEVQIPSPALCELIDLCSADGGNVIPLDMNDEEYTELYCDTVKALDFVKEHRHAKKGFKKKFNAETPEELAIQWDSHINKVKSYALLSKRREEYIATQIADVAKYRKSLLVVLEVERVEGILGFLEIQ